MMPEIITVGNWKRHPRQSCIGARHERPRGGGNEGRRLFPRLGHESLTLAFCLATRRCMNLGASLLVGLDTVRQ